MENLCQGGGSEERKIRSLPSHSYGASHGTKLSFLICIPLSWEDDHLWGEEIISIHVNFSCKEAADMFQILWDHVFSFANIASLHHGT